jgi:UDP-N-acetylmuramoyl-tripeptide--D-alanyl-D-alanine ligase
MIPFKITQLASAVKASNRPHFDGQITSVTTDSRNLTPGACFFAIKGPNFDGNDYVKKALDTGAACAVTDRDIDCQRTLKVADTTKALGQLAAEYRRISNFKLIAITGSLGKTTTRHITTHVLATRWRVHQSPKNFNNDIGLPLTILGAEADTDIVVAEIGANYPGEIEYLTNIAAPDIAVVTNVRPAHLAGFGDLETIKKEKFSIAGGLRPGGAFIAEVGEKIKPTNITHQGDSSGFLLEDTRIHLPLPGKGNIENAITAWCICQKLGMKIKDFASALESLPPIDARTELLRAGTVTILNDSYNASPASMQNAIETLSLLKNEQKQRAVFICGDMAELGPHTDSCHADLGRCIAKNNIDLLIAVGSFANATADAAKRGADNKIQTEIFPDTFSACNNLHKFIKEHDIVLVKASRSARLEMAVEKIEELFAEKYE